MGSTRAYHLGRRRPIAYDVVVETVAAQPIAAARQRTTFAAISQEIRSLLDGPWAFVRARPGLWTVGHNVAIYWDTADGGSIEVGIQVTRPFEVAHDAVMAWCRQHGHETALPFWEIYGDWDDDPAKLRTDVLYLLK